jgi:F0F1-type ATP synthase assembly protein I
MPEPYRSLSGLSTMRRAVTLIAAISLTLAGAFLSYIEAEAAHHVPTRLVLLALIMLGAGMVWLVAEISRTPGDQ